MNMMRSESKLYYIKGSDESIGMVLVVISESIL